MCDKCHNTGRIPFIKSGRVIANAWVYCECYDPPRDHYSAVTPSDYDFPCSGTFRAASFEYCNRPDPAEIPEKQDLTGIEARLDGLEDMVALPGVVPKKYEHQLEQVRAEVNYLKTKVAGMRKRKPKGDY